MIAGKRPDVGRIGAGVAGPQPQQPEVGAVLSVVADDQGCYVARVHLLLSDVEVTAAIAVPFAGPGYGDIVPVAVDDKVLCQPIGGLPDHGYVITARFWERSTPAPAEARQRGDVCRLAPADVNNRLATQGTGDAIVEARGGGKAVLGLDAATDPVALQSTLDALNTALQRAIDAMILALDPAVTALQAFQTQLDAINFPTCALKVVAI